MHCINCSTDRWTVASISGKSWDQNSSLMHDTPRCSGGKAIEYTVHRGWDCVRSLSVPLLEIPITPSLIHTEYQSLSWNDVILCEKTEFSWRSFSCGVQQVETGVAISNRQGYNWTSFSCWKYLTYALSIFFKSIFRWQDDRFKVQYIFYAPRFWRRIFEEENLTHWSEAPGSVTTWQDCVHVKKALMHCNKCDVNGNDSKNKSWFPVHFALVAKQLCM